MSSILDIYKINKYSVLDKSIRQILSFTGDGVLKNHNYTSQEFRALLSLIPTESLVKYANECLVEKFTDSGLVLQDIVNQAGQRLGFEVEYGLYQGSKNTIGYDGIWKLPNNVAIIVEVKTTDAYRINLDHIYSYKRKLVEQERIAEDSSLLIVVGRKDTGDLEAQIRGSRYGWDFRLISIDSLMKLVNIKQNLDDERTINQINEILRPLEFTRLDKLIDIVFETTQDITSESFTDDDQGSLDQDNDNKSQNSSRERPTPANFQDECINRFEQKFQINLLKVTRTGYRTAEETLGCLCCVSKEHKGKSYGKYWFALHTSQKSFLEKFKEAYFIYGCGSKENTFVIPYLLLVQELEHLWTTEKDGRLYWHIVIYERNQEFELQVPKDNRIISLNQYRV